MNKYKNYLNHIEGRYDNFRYLSDKNSLESIDQCNHIEFKWIENRGWFVWVFIDNSISPSLCFFWYLEICWDFEELFEEIKKFASIHNCQKIIWPINLSIWNTYRFSDTDFDKVLLGEYENNPQVHNTLIQNGFSIYEEYLTVYRNKTNPFTNYSASDTLVIEKIKQKDASEILYNLSNQIFDTAPRITYDQFLCYMKTYQTLYSDQTNIFLLKRNGKEIGFVSTFFTDTYFIIKTIGILKEYRKQGYGNMLLDRVFQYYFWKGIYESYGIYMRKTGEVMHMSDSGGSLYRKYFTYIYTL